jgi:LuxR family transcriptional regulator, quorum-sensing system regulator SdiA
MVALPPITAQIKRHLDRLASLSNSGYALAIHIRYTRPTLLYRSYGQSWIDHYTEKGFMLSDPTVRWGLRNTGMVNWSDLHESDPEGVFDAARTHGLFNGITYSTGREVSRTISGHTRSEAAFSAEERAELTALIDEIHRLTENFETLPKAEQRALRSLH